MVQKYPVENNKNPGSFNELPLIIKKLASSLDILVLLGSIAVGVLWLIGKPAFYTDYGPVMSAFTALSLVIMSGVRLARVNLYGWPTAISMALLGLVIGGNLSSLLMQTTLPVNLMQSFPDVVLTSALTSVGLILFCAYELLIVLRETPRSAFIIDDMLLHLALVPGGLTALGHLLDSPAYLSTGADARIGISMLEAGFMALYATSAVASNKNLFLWRFLAEGFTNRFVFALLFANQFIAPFVVALIFLPQQTPRSPGIELFVLLAGVFTTILFLWLQAKRRRS